MLNSDYVLGVELPALIETGKLVPVGLSRGRYKTHDAFFKKLTQENTPLKQALGKKVFLLAGRGQPAFFEDCIDKDNQVAFARQLLNETDKYHAFLQTD